jgi:peptidoglycan-associated lipoprotein
VLRADARASLEARAEAIQQHPELGVVTIQGHCDERGSDEYNLALGKKRAAAVKRYLVDLGVPASRLETVTFGESRPAVPGHDEKAWRYNRRSELTSEAVQSAKR